MDRGAFPIVLSLSPVISRTLNGREIGHAYQARCVAAWQACGFRVISVNAASEVPWVEALYPDVEVRVAARDMSALCGKPLIPLAEMVAVLSETASSIGGIVNSDVFLPPRNVTGWMAAALGRSGSADCLFLNREDVTHPVAASGAVYRYGFDAFFFKMSALDGLDLDPFTIGLPWWDYYLPMALISRGRLVASLERLPLRHLAHPQKWAASSWDYMFEVFRDRLSGDFVRLEGERGAEAPALTALVTQDRMARRSLRTTTDHGSPTIIDGPEREYREAYSASVANLIFQLSDVVTAPATSEEDRR